MRRSARGVYGVVVLLMAVSGACGGDPSRSDDVARTPAGKPAASAPESNPPSSRVDRMLAKMTLEEKVGQLFVPTFSGATPGSGAAMVKRYHLGGLVYFPGNFRTPRQTAELSNSLQKTAKIPLILATDQEQGIVRRARFVTRFPPNRSLAAGGAPDVRAAARITGTELRAVGINQNYAPVADVNVNPDNPVIGVRSFGADPKLVARLTGVAVDAYQSAGVSATAKHFPGHGDTDTDSHTGLPVIRHTPQQWEKLDAPPFKEAIERGVDAIMTAHIVVPRLDDSGAPSTMSKKVLTGLLREKLGFEGVIVTDSLSMAGARIKYSPHRTAVRALKAGADQLLMPPNLPKAYAAVLRAVRSGDLSRARLDDAVSRILKLKEKRGLFDDTRADPGKAAEVVGSPAHREAARRIAAR